ncbi:hypothetical protein GE061_017092 [Apolygus lucorum]|nr:hypothetical protein GE061_017092 [Apolygus lucorum]
MEETEQHYGRSLQAHLKLKDESIVIVTLPRRYAEIISEEELKTYETGSYAMIFKGFRGLSYDLEFIEVGTEQPQKKPRRK